MYVETSACCHRTFSNPPNKFVNNLNEALNLVIQEANQRNSVDIVTFIENVKTNVFSVL